MAKIKKIKAREILDSRGNPTTEVCLTTEDGIFCDSVPSGASTGKYEAVELRDGGKRYGGKGVLKAIANVNKIIAPKLTGKDVLNQKEIDELMIKLDGTENKTKLGANAILGVSMAVARAGADAKKMPLYKYIALISGQKKISIPRPSLNVINGGAHAGNDLDFQEFMVVPQFKLFSDSLRTASEIYHEMKKIIKESYSDSGTNVGDEGGYAPPLKSPEEALNIIIEAAGRQNYKDKIKIILDVASSQFLEENGKYKTKFGIFEKQELAEYYLNLVKKYPIIALEDPFAEDDFEGWANMKSKTKLILIGDDLLVTNPERMKMAKEKKACNGTIIKVNQIGTITEAIEAVNLAKSYGWKVMVSHRSGDTNDDFISDFAVGTGADFIKTGAPCRGERTAKYNRLLKIEEETKKL